MYDTYQPLRSLKLMPFSFKAEKYEVWENGHLVDNDLISETIFGRVQNAEDGTSIMSITMPEKKIFSLILPNITFEKFVSQTDRLQYISIPPASNYDGNGISALRSMFGVTNYDKTIDPKIPYCCSLFTEKKFVTKLSFSFNNPVKLIEFYAENTSRTLEHLHIAKQIVKSLISNYDNGDLTSVRQEEIKLTVQKDFNYLCSDLDLESSLKIINSIFPSERLVEVQKVPMIGISFFKRDNVYTSSYSLTALKTLLNSIDNLT